MRDDPRQLIAALRQKTRHLHGEKTARAHQAVQHEARGDDHDRRADHAPAGQQHQKNAQPRHRRVQRRIFAGAQLQRLEVADKVADHRQKRQREEHVQRIHPAAARLFRRRIDDKRQADGEPQVPVAQNLLRQPPAQRSVKLEQRETRQHDREKDFHAAGKDAIARIALQFGQIDVLRDLVQFLSAQKTQAPPLPSKKKRTARNEHNSCRTVRITS